MPFLTEGGCIWFGASSASRPVSVQEGDRVSLAQSCHMAWAAVLAQNYCELPKSLNDVLLVKLARARTGVCTPQLLDCPSMTPCR